MQRNTMMPFVNGGDPYHLLLELPVLACDAHPNLDSGLRRTDLFLAATVLPGTTIAFLVLVDDGFSSRIDTTDHKPAV